MTTMAEPVTMAAPPLWRGFVYRVLRLPLLAKLAGANGLIVVIAWMVAYFDYRARGADYRLLVVMGTALLVGALVNAALVVIALRPIRMLEATAERFWKGDLGARVPWSAVADRGIEKLSEALNLLLEAIELDRTRARALRERIIGHDEQERVHVARELQESLAQSLAGLLYTISAAQAECDSPECRRKLDEAREIAQRSVEEMRQLSGRVHPRLLEEFGFIAAVRNMARTMERNGSVCIAVDDSAVTSMRDVPPSHKAILYRVTEEAIRNAVAHAKANQIEVRVSADSETVAVEIDDDGLGFDPTRAGVAAGLRFMRERLAFIGGHCVIRSAPGDGTTVSVRLPIATAIIEPRRPTPGQNQEHRVA
jgi:signal transduction histidine kinase